MLKFKSNLKSVENALSNAEEKALESIGLFVTGESQLRSPVGLYTNPKGVYTSGVREGKSIGAVGGNLRDSNDYKIQDKKTVVVGNSTDYSVWVHEGTSSQRPQKFLEDSVYRNVNKIKLIVERQLRL